MKTKVTIKKDDHLERILGRCKDSADVVIDMLLNKLVYEEIINLDDTSLCGKKLPDLLHDEGRTLTWLANEIFKTCTFDLLDSMSKLQLWGNEYDCTECGCKMECEGDEKVCKNCDHTVDIGYERRLYEKYDVSVNFEHNHFLN